MTAPGDNGGGFGLFSIRERIALIGGRLDVGSTPGKGSRFTLTVPHRWGPAAHSLADSRPAATGGLPANGSARRGSSIHVLLADDHALFRDGVARLLGRQPGIRVVGHAHDGREAIELARKLRPDVILMDIGMPRVDGMEATRVIHREDPKIRVIGLSMHEDPERARLMRKAGAVDFKTKGCAADDLVTAIRSSMRRP
jgi:CheY-like chemotaxis protein